MQEMASYATTPGSMLALIRSGRARSRADLARISGLAPSTVTLRVQQLIDHGYITESEAASQRSGRRPRVLQIASADRVIAGIDLGARHAKLGLTDLHGELLAVREIGIDITSPPETVLGQCWEAVQSIATELERTIYGVGVAVPGPVSYPERRVVAPSRMPGWNGSHPADVLRQLSGAAVMVENDANALALGEMAALGPDAPRNMVVLKAGSSIGVGVIAEGQLYRGFSGVAGDISHTPVWDADAVLCACGRVGCLDVVAGGRAIIRQLKARGVQVQNAHELLQLAQDAHPLSTKLLRESGIQTGAVMATILSFFNPQRLVIAGSLAAADAFVAGIRASVYDRCLPMTTEGLLIEPSLAAATGGIRGVAMSVLHEIFDPLAVDKAIAEE